MAQLDVNAIPDFDAQMAHVGWGGFLTFFLGLVLPWYYAAFAVVLLAAAKESIESIWGVWEQIQPWHDGTVDFAFFIIGITPAAVALALVSIFR